MPNSLINQFIENSDQQKVSFKLQETAIKLLLKVPRLERRKKMLSATVKEEIQKKSCYVMHIIIFFFVLRSSIFGPVRNQTRCMIDGIQPILR